MKIIVLVVFLLNTVFGVDNWEDVHIICPIQCVCVHNYFMDLSVARWSQGFYRTKSNEDFNNLDNTNEVFDENDGITIDNPILKYAMCMLQDNTNIKDLIVSLPAGVQAFILLHQGSNKNTTILTSELSILVDMYILEIRGTNERTLQLIIDEPLAQVRYVNFDTIEILGSHPSGSKINSSSIHPSQLFDYVPESEKDVYNISLEIKEAIEIVPYEIYVMEQKMAKIASFDHWNKLHVLQIHNCKLDELHWEMFDGLTNLEHLSLEHNDIKIIPPFAFYGAMHIKTLSLARNNILDLNYRSLAGLLKLEWLDLSENNLTKLSEITFPPFPKLEWIDFRNNPIKYIFPMTFGVMNNTREIFIGAADESLELTGNIFQSLEALTSLHITNCLSQTLGQSLFKGLKHLQKLRIQGQIKRIEFDAFAEMPNIQELIMKDCALQEISMDAFIGVKKLEIIDLSNNNILILPPGLFDDQPMLKELYLQNNQLSGLPKTFFHIPSIKLMRLDGNPWFCSCDMTSWKQTITNRIRSTKIDRNCTINRRKTVECNRNHNEYNYVFDNTLTPRCDGGPAETLHRSVYYSIRKTLKCKSQSMMLNNRINNNTIIEKNHVTAKMAKKLKDLEAKELKLYGYKFTNLHPQPSMINEKQQRQHKMVMKYKKTVRNDLHYMLKTKSAQFDRRTKHRNIEEFNNII